MNAPSTLPVLQPGIVTRVPIGLLKPDPNQPRVDITEASLTDMAADVKARDIEHAIVVRADFTIKDGERRWRSAQLAGKEDVPVILAKPVSGETAGVDWRLDQVCDNHHREPLNALDWAKVLQELVTVHGQNVNALPALLKTRGINLSRSYISNLIRLNDLPAWSKTMIARGILPPAAGKYILMAARHAPAMKMLQKRIEAEAKRLDEGEKLQANQSWEVRHAYRETSTELTADSWESNRPRFNWKTSCAECQTRAQVDGDHFCLDRPCFDKKQSAGLDAEKKKEAAVSKTAKAKRKPDPREIARKHQERARSVAREQALTQIITKAEKSAGLQDRRLVAMAMIREMQNEHLKTLFAKRGWQPANTGYGGREYHRVADKEIAKLNAQAIEGLMIEMALRGNLTVGFYAGNTDFIATTARRYHININAIEKAELARLKVASKPAPVAKTKKAKPAKEKKKK